MSLRLIAQKHAKSPSDINLMTEFIDALAQEKSVEEIIPILSLDFERVTGLALQRLVELLPFDVELILSLALWNYHFGLDAEAYKYLERAKTLSPSELSVLQAEIYFNYDSPADQILLLANSALMLFPDDEWLLAVKRRTEETGQLSELNAPTLNPKWQKLISGPPPGK